MSEHTSWSTLKQRKEFVRRLQRRLQPLLTAPDADMPRLEHRILDLLALEDGWDSYDAKPITVEAAEAVLAALRSISLVPINNGGIQIEMGDLVEIEFSPEGLLTAVWPEPNR